jgi:hypothetical protein
MGSAKEMDMAGLQEKLVRMAESSKRRGFVELRNALGDLADEIARVLNSDVGDIDHDRVEMNAIVADAIAAAQLLDACVVIDEDVGARASLQDFDLPRSKALSNLQAFLDEEARRFAGDRSFVYVAWASRPELFHYVGMSGNLGGGAGRLKLERHGKLLSALQHSRVFTMILPRQEPRASAVEAAVLTVLGITTAFQNTIASFTEYRLQQGRSTYAGSRGSCPL